MPVDRPIASVRKSVRTTHTPPPVLPSQPHGDRFRNSPEPAPIDWDVALKAAAAMLDETFGAPGSLSDPLLADMVQDLAARLCAYDQIGAAVDHMHARPDLVPIKK
jgi:hypothetical protein